jgi:formamidopyrimidine-DNA glycosylase
LSASSEEYLCLLVPELAEVEFFRKRWHVAAVGESVARILTHDKKKLLRELNVPTFRRALIGATFESSAAQAKRMLFRFRRRRARTADLWLGIHLGMSGELTVEPLDHSPGKHDHLVLVTASEKGGRGVLAEPFCKLTASRSRQKCPEPVEGLTEDSSPCHKIQPGHALVFNDPRMFGRVLFHVGKRPPTWWTRIASPILSSQFTVSAVTEFLQRRRRAPIKAVLLRQERFPGVGNWMADEILWRAAIHPARAAGSLDRVEVKTLWRECRTVCRQALSAIAGRGNSLPRDLNVNIPRTWLFKHRWRRGGKDPKTGTPLAQATIGGRTTCWSPARQKL